METSKLQDLSRRIKADKPLRLICYIQVLCYPSIYYSYKKNSTFISTYGKSTAKNTLYLQRPAMPLSDPGFSI